MLKTICICDSCKNTVEQPIAVDFGIMEIATGDIIDSWLQLPERVHLCRSCATHIHNTIVSGPKKRETDLPHIERKTDEDKKKQPEKRIRVKIDIGKIVALRNAGWKIKDIADEMGLEPKQISQALYLEKRKREKESKENGSDN